MVALSLTPLRNDTPSEGGGNNVHVGGGPKSTQLAVFPGELVDGLAALTWETSMTVGKLLEMVGALLLEGATQGLERSPRKGIRGGAVPFLLVVGSHMGNILVVIGSHRFTKL
ncbi:hypothetical protein PIB30_022969 [Stylosanthes scabra]|uniref:Uncharacterized protein n=1 Tax=Stylosanthes scabra TaxID=79078 RepID=A0ABU6SA51_9FABA|nr:hypothetical protein [Stylosanthes scabra]